MLTDNGIQFTTPYAGGSAVPLIKEAIASGEIFRAHAFEYACARNDIEHRTTKARHPWTNGQVERMNRTIKDATVKRFYYEATTNSAPISPTSSPPTTSPAGSRPSRVSRPTSSLQGVGVTTGTFKLNPLQQMPGLNIWRKLKLMKCVSSLNRRGEEKLRHPSLKDFREGTSCGGFNG